MTMVQTSTGMSEWRFASINKYNYDDSSPLQIDTPDVTQFGLATASLKFESYDGGRDSKERLTQGLMVALEVMAHALKCNLT